MTTKKLMILAGSSILIAIAIVGVFTKKFNYIEDVVLSNEITVGPDWQTLSLAETMVISKDVNNFNLDPMAPFEFAPEKRQIVGPDGTEFLPEVEIRTGQGEIIPLTYSGGRSYKDHEFVSFGRSSSFIKGQTFDEIRIRSPREFKVRTIWWSSYDAKDMP
jgi:hypothetical protein